MATSNPFSSVVGLLVVPALALGGCSSKSDDTTPPPTPPAPVDVAFDTLNLGLAGSFVPNETARRPAIVKALAEYDSDVICLEEAWFKEDKAAIRDAVKAKYPNTASFDTTLDTPIDDATDKDGKVPPAPTTAPCEAADAKTGLEAGVKCLQDKCNTVPGSDTGKTTSEKCATDSCLGEVASLLGLSDLRCYGCLASNLPASTFAAMRSECLTNKNAGLAFGGQNGLMILSKHPLSDVTQRVLPGTWNRRNIVRATVTVPNGTKVDVYCNHLTAGFEGLAYPYTGQYGGGLTGKDAWLAEQLLQAQKLVAWVKTRPASTRTVILGDFNAGAADAAGGVIAESPAAFDVLKTSFAEALAAGYAPACTFCKDNANTDGTENAWIDHVFLSGIDAKATKATSRTFTNATVDAGGKKVPLSDHYGFRVTLTIPPP